MLDMFAGGGAIPLEGSAFGAATTALELNPVAHLIELCTSTTRSAGLSLADDVPAAGAVAHRHARREIG